jgi:hypothetical protein
MESVIEMIQNAPQIQLDLRQKWKDDNIIFKVYDRNHCMRTRWATIKGQAIGTCQEESESQLPLLHSIGFKPRLYIAKIYLSDLKRCIWHQYIVIKINGKKYVESKSNGLHKRIPLYVWRDGNDVRLVKEVVWEFQPEK